MSNSISIVIVNWNSGRQLTECLQSISRYRSSNILDVIVVDNGSTDSSEDFADSKKEFVLIRAGENLGFAKGCNLGARSGSAQNFLFLNPDSMILANTFDNVIAALDCPKYQDIGIFGIQLENEAGHIARSCARFPTAGSFFAHASGLSKVFPSWGSNMAEWPHDTTQEVDQVIGAFFLVRRSLFEILDGFDERFFVYFEEVDFCRRARNAGWKSIYLADAQAFHAGGGTSDQVKAARLFYSLRSRLLYSFKNLSPIDAVGVLIATVLLEPVTRSLWVISAFSWVGLKETWSSYRMLFSWIFKTSFLKLSRK